jgi:AcrR family transcriptional regulator
VDPTKRRIAEAFERRMSDEGYDRTTLDAVARELHISKKTIYVHFDGKRDIYAFLVAGQASREKARLAAAVADLPSHSARAEAVLWMVLQSAREHIESTGREEWLREYDIAADAYRQAYGELLRGLFEDGVTAGEFSPGDPVFVERMVSAMLLDYVVAVNQDPSLDRDAELVARTINFLK